MVSDKGVPRETLVYTLDNRGPYEVVRTCGHAVDWSRLQADRLEAVVVPVHHGCTCYEGTIRALRALPDPPHVLALCYDSGPAVVHRVFLAGGRAAVSIVQPMPDLLRALEDLLRTGFHYNALAEGYLTAKGAPETMAPPVKLGAREVELLRLLCCPEEHTYKQIAVLMVVSLSSIHTMRERLFTKLNVKSKAGLVLAAKALGLLEPEPDQLTAGATGPMA